MLENDLPLCQNVFDSEISDEGSSSLLLDSQLPMDIQFASISPTNADGDDNERNVYPSGYNRESAEATGVQEYPHDYTAARNINHEPTLNEFEWVHDRSFINDGAERNGMFAPPDNPRQFISGAVMDRPYWGLFEEQFTRSAPVEAAIEIPPSSSMSSEPALAEVNPQYPSNAERVQSPPNKVLRAMEQSNKCPFSACAKENKSFTRPSDLQRHLNEQHYCPDPACKEQFETKKDRNDHIDKEHPEVGFHCGSCELTYNQAKRFERLDKLQEHIRNVHTSVLQQSPSTLPCKMMPCCKYEPEGGTYFVSLDNLTEHIFSKHKPSEELCAEKPERESAQLHQLSESSKPVDNSIKRPLGKAPSRIQRGERETVKTMARSLSAEHASPLRPSTFKVDGLEIPSLVANDPRWRTDVHTPIVEGPSSVSSEVVIPSVRLIELFALHNRYDFEDTCETLQSWNISSSINLSQKMIKLRGSSPALEDAKSLLEYCIKEIRAMWTSEIKPKSAISRRRIGQPGTIAADIKLSPISHKENADDIKTWTDYIAPSLPQILRGLGEEHTACLVCHHTPKGKSIPTIQIQSPYHVSPPIKAEAEESIKRLCEINGRSMIRVHFSEGSVVSLVGTPQSGSADRLKHFPHHQRYWGKPGMGASIGLKHDPDVSATLGGYIKIDAEPYVLSVDHFISVVFDQDQNSATPSNEITSPSQGDAQEFDKRLRNIMNEIETEIEVSNLGREYSLQVLDQMFLNDFQRELELYKRYQKELENPIEFGEIRYRCGDHTSSSGDYIGYRMDWSVSKVKKERRGRNVHRYKYFTCSTTGVPREVTELGISDFEHENLSDYGSGMDCNNTGEPSEGVNVYYVGKRHGLRRGIINGTRLEYSNFLGRSSEWVMVPCVESDIPSKSSEDFEGDSGAWIIREDDNHVVGLLWGWANGVLPFTPIEEVFKHIKRVANASDVSLLPPSRFNRSAPHAIAICHDRNEERRKFLHGSSSPKDVLSSPELAKVKPMVTTTMHDYDRSPSPVPSLSSSISSSSPGEPSPRPFSPSPPLQSLGDLVNLVDELRIESNAQSAYPVFDGAKELLPDASSRSEIIGKVLVNGSFLKSSEHIQRQGLLIT